jgi:hypothetical protein
MNTKTDFNKHGQCEDGSTSGECMTKSQPKENFKVTDHQKGLVLRSANIKNTENIFDPIVYVLVALTNQEASTITKEVKGVDQTVRSSFRLLKSKIDIEVKKHINDMDLAVKQGSLMYKGHGSLSYKSKNFYVVELVNDQDSNKSQKNYSPIQPSLDKSLGYEFFMLRLINGDKKFDTAPNYKVVFDKQNYEPYDKGDVVGLFEYHNGNTFIQAFETIGDTIKVNDAATKILKEDKQELTGILKVVFNTYNKQCNDLKSVTHAIREDLSTGICQTIYDHEDQDFFIQYVTCKEIFTLAYDDAFCPTKKFVHTDILDDL